MKRGAILTINAGSSSVKFAVFDSGDAPQRRLSGQVERIGDPDTKLVATRAGDAKREEIPIGGASAAEAISEYLQKSFGHDAIGAIGHRVVHGGIELLDHQRVTPAVMEVLRKSQPLDMAHLPREIALIEAFGKSFPGVPQIACFDTAFFRELPINSRLLPIPRKYTDAGVRRFGFHGLSYTFLLQRLRELDGDAAANGRVILTHLGAGASMAAIRNGKPIDTTMAFTPTAGLMMATRPGDLDPGLLVYLMRTENLSADALDEFIFKCCGLIGVSQTSADMRDLQKARDSDPRAAQAVDLFCYQAKKYLGAFAAALGGVDTLVFAGGIGEHAWQVRTAICEGLEFLDLQLDGHANANSADVISTADSRVKVRVIATDEEIVMALIVRNQIDKAL